MGKLNGVNYRSLINDEPLESERGTSFDVADIRITAYGDYNFYNKWRKREDEEINYKLTETDIDIKAIIKRVILSVRLEEVVEVIIILKPL